MEYTLNSDVCHIAESLTPSNRQFRRITIANHQVDDIGTRHEDGSIKLTTSLMPEQKAKSDQMPPGIMQYITLSNPFLARVYFCKRTALKHHRLLQNSRNLT